MVFSSAQSSSHTLSCSHCNNSVRQVVITADGSLRQREDGLPKWFFLEEELAGCSRGLILKVVGHAFTKELSKALQTSTLLHQFMDKRRMLLDP